MSQTSNSPTLKEGIGVQEMGHAETGPVTAWRAAPTKNDNSQVNYN